MYSGIKFKIGKIVKLITNLNLLVSFQLSNNKFIVNFTNQAQFTDGILSN